MEIHRLGVKLFIQDGSTLSGRDLIPVFHGWIQQQAIQDHTLIDVHDYSHVFQGPGILLVGHEGNFSLDESGGRAGFLYYRKQPPGSPEVLPEIFRAALGACRLLETEPDLAGRARFRTDEFFLLSNDRLRAPNTAATLEELKEPLAAFLERMTGRSDYHLKWHSDPRERFSLSIRLPEGPTLDQLLRAVG